ncbi:MAG: SpaA isopeptide-forming pilin-related protein, partial [Candidatus Bathyarchaeota archaeon]|nr:SpaA isopeptide-forming pilin-related protein [Candidatus Bathyarchaeota archaeon]
TKAYAGDAIKYTIVVKNTGDCPLYNVNVTDTLFGDLLINGYLDVGKNITLTPTYTVKVNDPDPLKNMVTASGKDDLGLVVSANATVSVDLVAKICGYKFYDANANGRWDNGEQGVEGIKIELWLGNSKIGETTTGSDGSYCFDGLDAGTYVVKEVLPNNWVNTTKTSITVTLQSGEISGDNNFGNICLKPGYGGRTLGYWANAGNKLITSDDVKCLNQLNLYRPSRWSYPPFNGGSILTARSQIRNYLLSADAKDMRWMLSAQLIATVLNVRHGYLSNTTIVYVGPSTYVPSGFISIGEIIERANTALSDRATRATQEYWKNILDWLNNNKLYFVCQNPCKVNYP